MRQPLSGNVIITSGYGPRILNGSKQSHHGIDYVSDSNLVYAIAAGPVCFDYDGYKAKNRWDGSSLDSTGNIVIQKITIGGKIYFVRYLHLENNFVADKQLLKEGDQVGSYGDVGLSYGAHLHIDVTDIYGRWGRIDPKEIGLK